MALTFVAPVATRIFGVDYAAGATVDTSSWPPRAVQRALSRGWIVAGSAASSAWVEHPLSLARTNWNADVGGTWTSDGTTLSQTNPTGNSTIWSKARYPSLAYIVEAEVLLASGQDGGITPLLVMAAGEGSASTGSGAFESSGEGFVVSRTAPGDTGDIALGAWVDGDIVSGLFVVGAAANQWNTVRAVISPFRQNVYLNGVHVLSNEVISGGNKAQQDGGFGSDPQTGLGGEGFSTDQFAFSATGLASFRNARGWTLALPA